MIFSTPDLGDVRVLRAVAGELRSEAAHVSDRARVARGRAEALRWQCPRADRFRAELRASAAKLDAIADQMRALAAQLEAEASHIEHEIRQRLEFERRVRAELARLIEIGPLPVGLVLHALPPPGDERWRTLARQLGVGR